MALILKNNQQFQKGKTKNWSWVSYDLRTCIMDIYGPEGHVLYCKEHTEALEAGRPSFGSSLHHLVVTKIQAGSLRNHNIVIMYNVTTIMYKKMLNRVPKKKVESTQ